MALHAYSGPSDEGSSPGFTLISEVGAWLETLPDVEGNAELRRIQEAVQTLDKPTKQSVLTICAAWQQAKKRNGKKLPVAVVVDHLCGVASSAAQPASLDADILEKVEALGRYLRQTKTKQKTDVAFHEAGFLALGAVAPAAEEAEEDDSVREPEDDEAGGDMHLTALPPAHAAVQAASEAIVVARGVPGGRGTNANRARAKAVSSAAGNFCIGELPFSRLVRELAHEFGPHLKYELQSLVVLQVAAERFLESLFQDAQLCAAHARRLSLFPADLALAIQLRYDGGDRLLWNWRRVTHDRKRRALTQTTGEASQNAPKRRLKRQRQK
jgi:histone H3/H4